MPSTFYKKNSLGKGDEAGVTILDSSYSVNENDCNFITFMASMSNYNLPTKTSQSHKDFEEDEDDQDGF